MRWIDIFPDTKSSCHSGQRYTFVYTPNSSSREMTFVRQRNGSCSTAIRFYVVECGSCSGKTDSRHFLVSSPSSCGTKPK